MLAIKLYLDNDSLIFLVDALLNGNSFHHQTVEARVDIYMKGNKMSPDQCAHACAAIRGHKSPADRLAATSNPLVSYSEQAPNNP